MTFADRVQRPFLPFTTGAWFLVAWLWLSLPGDVSLRKKMRKGFTAPFPDCREDVQRSFALRYLARVLRRVGSLVLHGFGQVSSPRWKYDRNPYNS